MSGRRLAGAVLFCVTGASVATGQTAGSLAINAGNATDVTGAGASAFTIAPSFAAASALSSLSIGGSATRFGNDAWSAGVNGGLNARAGTSAIVPVLSIAAGATTTSYDVSYATADLVPSIEAQSGAARFFVGGRLGVASTSSTILRPGGPLAPIPGGERRTVGNSARSLIGGLGFTTVASNGEVGTIGYRAESGTVAGARQTDHAVTGSVAGSTVVLSGMIGRRSIADAQRHPWQRDGRGRGDAARLLQFAAGNYPANPMLGTAAGQFVNAGLTMRLGRRAMSMPAADRRDAARRREDTRLAIRANDARRVELAGDFNKWQFASTTRAGNGVWYVDLALPPGEYRYAFRIDGKEWRVPEGVVAADDEFGGKSAWLTVKHRRQAAQIFTGGYMKKTRIAFVLDLSRRRSSPRSPRRLQRHQRGRLGEGRTHQRERKRRGLEQHEHEHRHPLHLLGESRTKLNTTFSAGPESASFPSADPRPYRGRAGKGSDRKPGRRRRRSAPSGVWQMAQTTMVRAGRQPSEDELIRASMPWRAVPRSPDRGDRRRASAERSSEHWQVLVELAWPRVAASVRRADRSRREPRRSAIRELAVNAKPPRSRTRVVPVSRGPAAAQRVPRWLVPSDPVAARVGAVIKPPLE